MTNFLQVTSFDPLVVSTYEAVTENITQSVITGQVITTNNNTISNVITDNGDGTFTANVLAAVDNGNGTFTTL